MVGPGPELDLDLVRRACAGESVAFELLVVRYQRRVASWIRSMISDSAVIEELTQEVFLTVFQRIGTLREPQAFEGWLRSVARNAATSDLRARRRRIEDSRRVAPDADPEVGPQTVAGADAELEARQLFALIDAAIDALPPRHREAMMLRDVQGLDYRSIAEAMQLPVNTVRSHIFRARDAVAARIRPLLAPTRSRRW